MVEAAEAVACLAGHLIVATGAILAEEAAVEGTKADEADTVATGVARRRMPLEITMVRGVRSLSDRVNSLLQSAKRRRFCNCNQVIPISNLNIYFDKYE